MSKTNIQWTQESWNPVVGCSILSPGCTNCYAMKMASRIERMNAEARERGKGATAPQYDGTTRSVNGNVVWSGKLALAGDNVLLQPLKRKQPTTYFVNSMGDLFHEDVPDEWIDKVFAVMALSPQHTFQVLTKRAQRMRDYLCDIHLKRRLCASFETISPSEFVKSLCAARGHGVSVVNVGCLPLANVWLGVSTERQQEADERIPLLLQTPAAVRFISAEPLLGPIDLTGIRAARDPAEPESEWLFDALDIGDMYQQRFSNSFGEIWYDSGDGPYREAKLDWVIVGGESGHEARSMHPAWARSLRVQCEAAGVAFFFKQWGAWGPSTPERAAANPRSGWKALAAHPHVAKAEELYPEAGAEFIEHFGGKRAGRALDGIEYNEMPEAAR